MAKSTKNAYRNFQHWYAACAEAILLRIEAATGKSIMRESELLELG